MTIGAGSKLSFYEVVAPLGAGTMGEVWRARDTKLDREVAIKILPEHFADDPERLRRFEREAKTLAALNHPNVAQIFGVDQVGDTCFLVLELVPGESLEERLKRGPLPLDEALETCRQIAEGLEAAHEAGVIHRDLKPANVRVTPDGKVKLLDFGLARPASQAKGASATDSVLSTEAGRLLGTPTYMAPEQARGRAIDRRVDVWAFGCVLYECLTAKRAFDGQSLSDVLGSVLRDEADLSRLPAGTPQRVRELIARCLVKDPHRRLRDAGEARLLLGEPLPEPPARERRPRRFAPALLAALAFALGACLMLALGALSRSPRAGATDASSIPRANPRVAAVAVRLDPGIDLYANGNVEQNGVLAISPDGALLAFAGTQANQRRLFLRAIDSPRIRRVEGSEGGIGPFFSPDGRWLAFIAKGKLLKASVDGGQPIAVCDVGLSRGGAWGPDNTIVFASTATSPLSRVSANGGSATQVTTLDGSRGERSHRWPVFLPGGEEVAFTVGTVEKPGEYDDADIDAVRLATGSRRTLVRGASYARVLQPDALVLGRARQLFALPLSRASGGPLGGLSPVLDGVDGVPASGVLFADLAASGDLVYAERDPLADRYELAWLSPDGKVEPLDLPPREYQTPRISPDGKRMLVAIGPGGGSRSDVWVHDFGRGTMTRLTFDDHSGTPCWIDGGRRVLYGSIVGGQSQFSAKLADGDDDGEVLVRFADGVPRFPTGLTPNGDLLPFVTQGTAGTAQDIFYLSRSDAREHELVRTSAAENFAVLSPDGSWIAYVSDETGSREVYVQKFPERHGRWQVSEGGSCPVWSRDGREIYYVDGSAIRAVRVSTEPTFSSERPRMVAQIDFLPASESLANYDIAPDGRLLIVRRASHASSEQHLNVVLGWGAGMQRGGESR